MHSCKSITSLNLYEHIAKCGLEQKLMRQALGKSGLMKGLWEDAAQEIRIAWLNAQADEEFSNGETASYAHRIAFTTALKIRRDLGGPVRLPGSAFRFRIDGTQYASSGHLAPPIYWDHLPDELKIDESNAISDNDMPWVGASEALTSECEQLGPHPKVISIIRQALTGRQRRLVSLLVQGNSLTQIEYIMDISHDSLLRHFRNIRKKLQFHYDCDPI